MECIKQPADSAGLLKQVVGSSGIMARCKELAARLQGTDPLTQACIAIEQLVNG